MNIIKTFILLAGLTALFGWIGAMLGGQQGMVIALVFAAVMNIGSYWFSDKIVLKMYGAQPVKSGALYNMTLDLAQRAGLPMPRVYIINSPQPNAFATGRNPQNAAVAVNTGLMDILTERELAGVVAHELAHIKNRDTLIMTITATIAGAISMLANFAMFFGGGSQNGERQGANPIVALLVMFLAPMAAMLVQMAISRTREYSADKTGAEICGDPLALAGALQKLEQSASRIDNHIAEANPATAHMFIINPLHAHRIDNLFSTHPNTANRIEALQRLASGSIKTLENTQLMKKFLPFFAALMMSAPATASVLSVSSPDVEKGELSIETGFSWEMDDRQDDFREYVLEIGYSPTDYWNTALEFSVEDNNGDAEYAVTAWKNTLQFIEQRDGVPLSAGLRLQYERARLDDEADEIAARLLFRHQNEIIDTRLNIGTEREIGPDAENDFTGDIRASIRYKWSEKFRPAIDYLGDTGSLQSFQSFKNQDHRIGPVIYGSFDNISYEAGYFTGLSIDTPDHTFKLAFGFNF